LNHALGGIIKPLRPVEADSNTLTSAFGATADMAGPAAGSTRSRMTDAVEKGLVIFGEQ
jgi:hypothetical protein